MNPYLLYGLAGIAGVFVWKKFHTAPSLKIPSDAARAGAAAITEASIANGCTGISPALVQSFQLALNPWLTGTYPLVRTDGVLDADTANWVDDVNTFYNGAHDAFTCQGIR